MEFLKTSWPIIVVVFWFLYRAYKSYALKKKLPQLKEEGAMIVDVRTENEYAAGHAPDTINIPLDKLSQDLERLSKDKPIVVCCASGMRSLMAQKVLKKHGFKNVHNIGSWRALH